MKSLPPGTAPADDSLAITAWNMLGGFDLGPALDRVIDLLGIDDEEMLVTQLMAIRDFQAKKHG